MRHLCPLLKKLNHCARFSKRFAHSIGLFVNLPSGQRLEIQSLARWYAWSCAHLAKKWLGRWSFPGCLSIDPCSVLPHNVQTTEYEAMTSQPQLIVQELDENGSWCQCLESPKTDTLFLGKVVTWVLHLIFAYKISGQHSWQSNTCLTPWRTLLLPCASRTRRVLPQVLSSCTAGILVGDLLLMLLKPAGSKAPPRILQSN